MMRPIDIEIKLKALKPVFSERFFVQKIGYFGSYLRNEQTDKSDIDILVDFKRPVGWEFFDLKEFLEMELKTKVDLVFIKALKEQLKEIILKEVRYV